MAKSLEKLSTIVSSVNSDVVSFTEGYNDFLKEQAYGVVSQEIPNVDGSGNPLAIGIIQLENDMKGKILKFSKVVLTFPDGSNPLIIPNDYGVQPGVGAEDKIIVYVNPVGAQVYPDTTYPVGSLILGLDYEANTVLGAAGGEDATGGDVQYYSGGALTGSSMPPNEGGSLHDFKFNRSSGVVIAEGFSGDGSALTNLPTSDPAGSNTDVQFNDNGSLAGSFNLTYDKNTGEFNAPRFLGENISAGIYQDTGGYYAMYLTPDDFIATNNGSQQGIISNDGGRMGWSSISYNHYATFQVPKGYKVTSVDLKGSANYNFFVYASSWSSQYGIYKATGTMNTQLSLLSYQQLIGNSGDYFMIKFRPSGYGNYIYGCKILLYPT